MFFNGGGYSADNIVDFIDNFRRIIPTKIKLSNNLALIDGLLSMAFPPLRNGLLDGRMPPLASSGSPGQTAWYRRSVCFSGEGSQEEASPEAIILTYPSIWTNSPASALLREMGYVLDVEYRAIDAFTFELKGE